LMMSSLPGTHIPGYQDQASVARLSYRQLGATDMRVSSLSFGASSLGGVFRDTEDEQSARLVEDVVKKGINYIDTAPWYGQGRSERVLGRALKNIPRKAFYLATKVGRYEQEVGNMFDFTREQTTRSVEQSLERLGVEYIDLIQVHDVEFCHDLRQLTDFTLPALLEMKAQGKVRYIGLTGYSLDTITRLVELLPPGTVDCVLTYCRSTLIDQTLLGPALSFFKSRDIGVINASPVSMGLLSTRGPPSWHPATPNIIKASAEAAAWCQEQGHDITDISVLWSLAMEQIPTTLISTANPVNMARNIELAQTRITEEQQKLALKVMEKFFRPLAQVHWENLEVNKYWEEMTAAGLSQNSDL